MSNTIKIIIASGLYNFTLNNSLIRVKMRNNFLNYTTHYGFIIKKSIHTPITNDNKDILKQVNTILHRKNHNNYFTL